MKRALISLAAVIATAAVSAQDIDLRLIAVEEPSADETLTVLPASILSVPAGESYYLELWGSDVGDENTGISAAFVDLAWPGELALATGVNHGSYYTFLTSGTILAGYVDELGGATFDVRGVAPEWVRIAYVAISATDLGPVTFTLAASTTGVGAYGRGQIPWDQIALTSVTVEHFTDEADIVVQLVPVSAPGPDELVTTLPAPLAAVPENAAYFLELWTSDIGFLNTGVTSAYVDLAWPAVLASATAVAHSSIYDTFPSGTIGLGAIDELGGSTFAQVAIEPYWARVAVVTVTADAAGTVMYAPLASDTGIAAYDRGQIDWGRIALLGATVEQFVDCNDNGVPDDQDILSGASADCDLNGVPDECQLDSDGDGLIDPCDECPADPYKTEPGICGCGVPDDDIDQDGWADCIDNCPTTYNPDQADCDNDGVGDACDNIPPTVTCPDDLAGATDAGQCSAQLTFAATGDDNCGEPDISYHIESVPGSGIFDVLITSPHSFPVGVTTVRATATDTGGNTAICTFTVSVTDAEDPAITCPAAVAVGTDPGQCQATEVDLGTPAVSDNCGVAGVTNDAPPAFPVGITSVTWTVTDVNGNSATCVQSVTVTDDQLPAITCPPDMAVSTDPGQCQATGIDLGTPTVSDNCGVAGMTNDAPPAFPVGITSVTWTVTDVNGHDTTCVQSVTVTDDEPPAITCPPDVAASTDPNQCHATGVTLGTPAASDNCGVASITNNAPTEFPLGITTVTWTVTDIHGRQATCAQAVSVTDEQDPDISCPPAVFGLTDPGVCHATGVPLGSPAVADNCQLASVTNNAPAEFPIGTTTVTWMASDTAGNTAVCLQQVTIADQELPSLTCPPDVAVDPDEGEEYASEVELGQAQAADNCGLLNVINDAPTLFPMGETLVTWTATDINGNTATCTQRVTVTPTTWIEVTVELSPITVATALTRCIRFEIWNCNLPEPVVLERDLTFTNGLATALLPAPFDSYDCVSAQDPLHTVRRVDSQLENAGARLLAAFTGNPAEGGDWLVGGNLNGDPWIDILDFTTYVVRYGVIYASGDTPCGTAGPHADIDGDGLVNTADFTFIAVNFFQADETDCCNHSAAAAPRGRPIERLRVDDLPAFGLHELRSADLNGDGWIDQADIITFLQSVPPASPAAPASAAPAAPPSAAPSFRL